MRTRALAALLGLLVSGAAAAKGTVYVNGVRADGLRDFEFTNVGVRVDKDGNIWIDAPQYRVQVEETEEGKTQPVAVASATYWLVTEDNGSTGQVVDIFINGEQYKHLVSGDPQVIEDIGPYLRVGTNVIAFQAAPGKPGGGAMFVYIGRGSNEGGTVRLEAPEITWARRSTSSAKGESKTFYLTAQ